MKTLCVEHRNRYEVDVFVKELPSRYVRGSSFYEAIGRFVFYRPEDIALNVSWSGRVFYVNRRVSFVSMHPSRIFSCTLPHTKKPFSVQEVFRMFGRFVFDKQEELSLSIPEEAAGCRSSNVLPFSRKKM